MEPPTRPSSQSRSCSTAELVDRPSVASRGIVEWPRPNRSPLRSTRIGDNLVARTSGTVPIGGRRPGDHGAAAWNEMARARRRRVVGLGSADMRAAGLACWLARAVADPVGPEVRARCQGRGGGEHNGLAELHQSAPSYRRLTRPFWGTDGGRPSRPAVREGVRVRVEVSGARAHTARPWMVAVAIDWMGPILDVAAGWEPRRRCWPDVSTGSRSGGPGGWRYRRQRRSRRRRRTIHHRFAPTALQPMPSDDRRSSWRHTWPMTTTWSTLVPAASRWIIRVGAVRHAERR